jgi:hypothetical protein
MPSIRCTDCLNEQTTKETRMDQSNRYADLSLKEEDLIKGGKHILVAYKMKPKAGYGYLEAAAHFAAESSTGTNVEVSTTDDFTKRRRCAGLSDRRGDRGNAHRLSDRPVRPQHHRRPHDDGVLPDPGHRQQPGHGRHRARQDVRLLHARARHPAVRRPGQGHLRHVAHPRPPGQGRRLHRRHHHQAQARPASRALRQGGLPVLARRRLHQERRAPGQPGVLPGQEGLSAGL